MNTFVDQKQIDAWTAKAMTVALEEIFTNLLKYSVDGVHPIQVRLESDDREMVIEVTEFEVPSWDFTNFVRSDMDRPISDRRPGGMGLALVREITDSMAYRYENHNSVITLRRRLEA